ncbi:hypothetical protein NEOLEDRAFT_1071534, partial [Neolentinus lepideus HHB14362 ss-1]
MPVLVDIEALAAAPADTGRPETSKEFAKRIRKFRLLGPRVPSQEGGVPGASSTQHTQRESSVIKEAEAAIEEADADLREHAIADTEPDRTDADDGVGLLSYIAYNESTSIEDAIRNKYDEDPMFNAILKEPKGFKNFNVEGGLVFLRLQDRRVLCIPDITYNGRNVREVVISNAHILLAHLGAQKTLDLLRDHVWWK